jgi:NADH-quinone oxidoreductase subunit N
VTILQAILPELILGCAATFFFGCSLFNVTRNLNRFAVGWSLAAFLGAILAMNGNAEFFHSAYRVDGFSRFFALFITGGFFVTMIITRRMEDIDRQSLSDLYFFLTISTLGLVMVTGATELLTLFIALEISSYPLYITTSYRKGLGYQFEATAKYLVFGVVSTALMVYGISYLYGGLGSTFLKDIVIALPSHLHDPLTLVGVILFMAGILYKLAAFPFHFWAPDVYSGAAAEMVAFAASLPKLAAVALLARVGAVFIDFEVLGPALALLAVLSMTVGNLMALAQQELKRLLAYSAVSHAGYILLGILAASHGGLKPALFYTAVYGVMSLAAFLVAIQMAEEGKHDIPLTDLKGLWKRTPLLAVVFTIALISLAGLPPTAGFTGKLMLLTAAWKAGWFWTVAFGVLNSLLGLFVYLNIIRLSLVGDGNSTEVATTGPLLQTTATALGVCLLVLGMYPSGLLGMARKALEALLLI